MIPAVALRVGDVARVAAPLAVHGRTDDPSAGRHGSGVLVSTASRLATLIASVTLF